PGLALLSHARRLALLGYSSPRFVPSSPHPPPIVVALAPPSLPVDLAIRRKEGSRGHQAIAALFSPLISRPLPPSSSSPYPR
ncbi:Os12g0203900, partial [Oryza sativa Japonica Group]